MKKVWLTVFLIFGTVVGSGFSSGKEIFVFFSRFGPMSYFYIFVACFIFFVLFYLFLSKGRFVVDKMLKIKYINIIIIFISMVFCASMFAGLKSLFSISNNWLYSVLCGALLIFTTVVTLKGVRGLEKVNIYLMPVAGVIFLAVLLFASFQTGNLEVETNSLIGGLYCPLYVALNLSTASIIISRAGEELTKKQTFFSSLFSAVLLFLFLILGNFVLRKNAESFYSDMPFLAICKENQLFYYLCYIVILAGCLTTLLSLCVTLFSSIKEMAKSKFVSVTLSVFLPFIISEIGFSYIVAHLYPLASVIGLFLLLFFILLLKQADKPIHPKSEDTKNQRR